MTHVVCDCFSTVYEYIVCGFLHAGRYHSKQLYKLEILNGHIELGIDKVVLYGIAGSGKTSAIAANARKKPSHHAMQYTAHEETH